MSSRNIILLHAMVSAQSRTLSLSIALSKALLSDNSQLLTGNALGEPQHEMWW